MKVLARFFPVIFLLLLGHSYLYANTNLNGSVLTIRAAHPHSENSTHFTATEVEEDHEEDEKTNLPRKFVTPDDYFGIFFNHAIGHPCRINKSFPPGNSPQHSSLPRYIRHRVFRI